MTTKIEWCDATINPVAGCTKCSPACRNCYAERMAARWAKHPNLKISDKYEGVVDRRGRWNGQVTLDRAPFTRLPKKSQSVFLASMGDLFHERVPFEFLFKLWRKMGVDYSHHHFLVLTKRAERMRRAAEYDALGDDWRKPPFQNIWLGVTVCNQAEADEKIPNLLATPAAGRFVSIEPMLGPIDLRYFIQLWNDNSDPEHYEKYGWSYNDYSGGFIGPEPGDSLYDPRPGLDWVICGGETGPGSRPMQPAWVRSLRDQCRDTEIPFFFKGWGDWCPSDFQYIDGCCNKTNGRYHYVFDEKCNGPMRRLGKKAAGRNLDGIEHNDRPY